MPLKKHLKELLYIFLFAAIFLAAPVVEAQGQTSGNTFSQSIETKHSTIRYDSINVLKKLDGKLDYSPGEWSLGKLFSASGSEGPIASVKKKVDALFERAQEILGMRGKVKKVIINICANQRELHDAYYRITGRQCRIRAWYIFRTNRIFINVNDVHEGMLAHEMAHSIIDHYLMVPPPRTTAEILARYVDAHLYE
ncbi:MAG: hypothetical protein JRF53_10645 [Deltaproteobacteria bacterium]|nr:hypothetical protein [Deltaproteobacteria bacterium]MBW2344451.1 hypothetical protein [Deltaproteobacteria bacterium]